MADPVIEEFKKLYMYYLRKYNETRDRALFTGGEALQWLAEKLKNQGLKDWEGVYEWTAEMTRKELPRDDS